MYYVSALIGERDVRALSGEITDQSDESNVKSVVWNEDATFVALSYEYSWFSMRIATSAQNVLMMGTELFSSIEPEALTFATD